MSDIDHEQARNAARGYAKSCSPLGDVARWALALDKRVRELEVEREEAERGCQEAINLNDEYEAEVARLREALVLAREVARDAHRQHHDVWDALDGLERVDDIARAALEPKP